MYYSLTRSSISSVPWGRAESGISSFSAGRGKRSTTENKFSDFHFSQIPLVSHHIQPKLTVNQPNDKFEQEANRVADRVIRMDTGSPESSYNISRGKNDIQRKCAACEKKDEELRRKPQSTGAGIYNQPLASPALQSQLNNSGGKGRPLPRETNEFMSRAIGADFSGVRIHTGNDAARMNHEISARAFTYGSDIYFNRGEYNPGTQKGKRLLGHELTHVVQQSKNENLVQRSCTDGKCKTCAGGKKTLWMTIFFARRADKKTMSKLDKDLIASRSVLSKCCVDLQFNFDWSLLPGPKIIKDPAKTARPAGDPKGIYNVPADEKKLGESKLISKAKGIPALVVDEVKGSGGATTILGGKDDTGQPFDKEYTGRNMVFLAPNQAGYLSGCSAIAHELWHIGGALRHNPAEGGITACTNNNVSQKYCNEIRKLAK